MFTEPLDLGGDKYGCWTLWYRSRGEGNEATSCAVEVPSISSLYRVFARGAVEGVVAGVYATFSAGVGELDGCALDLSPQVYEVALELHDIGGDKHCWTLRDGWWEDGNESSSFFKPLAIVGSPLAGVRGVLGNVVGGVYGWYSAGAGELESWVVDEGA